MKIFYNENDLKEMKPFTAFKSVHYGQIVDFLLAAILHT